MEPCGTPFFLNKPIKIRQSVIVGGTFRLKYIDIEIVVGPKRTLVVNSLYML